MFKVVYWQEKIINVILFLIIISVSFAFIIDDPIDFIMLTFGVFWILTFLFIVSGWLLLFWTRSEFQSARRYIEKNYPALFKKYYIKKPTLSATLSLFQAKRDFYQKGDKLLLEIYRLQTTMAYKPILAFVLYLANVIFGLFIYWCKSFDVIS